MSKQAFEIIGTAYECRMVKKSLKSWEIFYGAPFKEYEQVPVKITKEECKLMNLTKKFGINSI